MQIEWVLGNVGVGKTTYCYEGIEQALKKERKTSLIMLVPEQFNLQTQVDLAKRLYPGLLRAQVLSFNTLAREVFNEVGKPNIPVIDDLERMMILKKLLEEHKSELIFFNRNTDNAGFMEALNQMITVFEQGDISIPLLQEIQNNAKATNLFKSKMQDLITIYQYFQYAMEGQFVTAEKTMQLLIKAIPKSTTLTNASIWIDGFYGFTTLQRQVIEQLIKNVQRINITMPMDKVYGLETAIQNTHPFYESIWNYQQLMMYCMQEKIPYQITFLEEKEKNQIAPAINHITKHYFKLVTPIYKEKKEGVKQYLFANQQQEIEQVAKKIIQLVRDKEYRYQDMAVIVGDLPTYEADIKSLFAEYEIPYFLDQKRNIQHHSLVATIEGILDVILTSYSYKSMMVLLKNGLFSINQTAGDYLENYLLAKGIKTKKKWHQEWEFDPSIIDKQELIIEAKHQLLEKVKCFEDALTEIGKVRKASIKEYTYAVYTFLEQSQALDTMQQRIQKYTNQNQRELAMENTQIVSGILEIFERLVAILGNEIVSLKEYKKIIMTSFQYLEQGIIPSAKDQVLIGTLERTRIPRLKAVFILGANEGLLPKLQEGQMLFSITDKNVLQQVYNPAQEKQRSLIDVLVNEELYRANFSLYTLLTRPTDELWISAIIADSYGKLLRPASVFYKIKKMMGGKLDKIDNSLLEQVYRVKPTFGYIGKKIRDRIEGRDIDNEDWKDIVSWYKESKDWKDKLLELEEYLSYTNQQHYLQPLTTKKLYGELLTTNISQLEKFRQCACCYFIQYGLKAKERKLLTVDNAKMGTVFHAALEQYPKELKKLNTYWTTATHTQRKAAIGKATEMALTKYSPFEQKGGKHVYMITKIENMMQRAVSALTHHLQNSDFIPKEYEVSFGENQDFPPIHVSLANGKSMLITGQIDRVDIYYKDEETFVKILDYKTGNKQFSLLEVYYGLQLQLLVYLDAYLKQNNAYQPGGIFYFHIQTPYIMYEPGMNEEKLQQENVKQFQLSGLVLENKEVIQALDHTEKKETIPVKIKKDGEIGKNSSIANKLQFTKLQEHMIQLIQTLGMEILSGKVSAKPYQLGTKDPCEYCKYKTICQFDTSQTDNCHEILQQLNQEEIWEQIASGKEEKESGMDKRAKDGN